MKFKSLGWLLILLFVCLVCFVVATMAWTLGVGWAFGLLGVVWGAFLLADLKGWAPLRDAIWAANAGYGFSVMHWLDLPVDAFSGVLLRLLALAACALGLVLFVAVVPGVLGWIAARFRPPAEPELPTEAPASPGRLRQWGPRD
jgi:hypothetical protein